MGQRPERGLRELFSEDPFRAQHELSGPDPAASERRQFPWVLGWNRRGYLNNAMHRIAVHVL